MGGIPFLVLQNMCGLCKRRGVTRLDMIRGYLGNGGDGGDDVILERCG
jgi:hypothetical protein